MIAPHSWDGVRFAAADLLAPRPTALPDPIEYSRRAGIDPDPWQATVLTSEAPRIILLCSRQSGKSTTVGTKAIFTSEHDPGSLVLIGAPSQNQSAELLMKAKAVYQVGGASVAADQESVLRMTFANRSRIICVPGKQGTVRAYSAVKLLVVDEAAYVPDEFYQAVLPMIAVSQGRVILLSTPHVKAGAFYSIWTDAPEYDPTKPVEMQPDAWLKIRVTWEDCPRISEQFVAEYRRTWGEHAYLREFCCEFLDSEYGVFTREEVDAMGRDDVEQWAVW